MKHLSQIASDPRISRRFTPAFSVTAAVLDGDCHVMQGVVANISEVGASLVTGRFVHCGPNITLKLTEPNHGLFETKARIVWQGDGIAPGKEIVGWLLGVSFLEVSPKILRRIRDLYLIPDVDFSYSQDRTTSFAPRGMRRSREGRSSKENGTRKTNSHGKKRAFDLLIDPAIDDLFFDEPGDRQSELDEIRKKLQPYLL